ncbi:uncharacterized protein [Engystomops pustulosus]|uniref:uncharacterized protein n=1 Tax=Engystomops pustulosus TaxID=76066 RepID=UPI003AFA297B
MQGRKRQLVPVRDRSHREKTGSIYLLKVTLDFLIFDKTGYTQRIKHPHHKTTHKRDMKRKRQENSPPDPHEPAPKRRKLDLTEQEEKMAAPPNLQDDDNTDLQTTSCQDQRQGMKRKRQEETSPPDHQEPEPKRKMDKQMKAFLKLLEFQPIKNLIEWDRSRTLTHKYLLAAVCAYFRRARLPSSQYKYFFFPALYLASQFEDDDPSIRRILFLCALGPYWFINIDQFLHHRDLMFQKIGFRAWVDVDTCHRLMAQNPTHWAWTREKPRVHPSPSAPAPEEEQKESTSSGFSCHIL